MNGKTVMVNDPRGGTLQGTMIDGILKRPEFSGAHVTPSTKGEGAAALARGEGDMAVQLAQEILNKPEIEVVAPLPVELGGHIDAVLAVSVRSTHPERGSRLYQVPYPPRGQGGLGGERLQTFLASRLNKSKMSWPTGVWAIQLRSRSFWK